jgi:hypothetical protein
MRALVLFAAALVASVSPARASDRPCTQIDAAVPEAISWLKGEWVERSGENVAHQYWSGPSNGLYVGHEIFRSQNGATTFAFLRIAPTAAGFSLFISLNGMEPFELQAVEACRARLVFEGGAHGHRRRVVYAYQLGQEPAKTLPEDRRFRPKLAYPLL